MSEYTSMIDTLPYKSLDECEKALKERYTADYDDISSHEYNKTLHNVNRSISRIFLALSECASCDEVLTALGGKPYRIEAFERYLKHDSYMPVFYQAL